jgi:hypothetical protein
MKEVADLAGGTFSEGKATGGYSVVVDQGPWRLTLGIHMVRTGTVNMMHTRVVARFVGRDGLRLVARPKTFADRLAEKLRWRPAPLGGRELARRYVVRGRPEARLRSVLSGGLADALAGWQTLRVEVGRAPWGVRRRIGPDARQLQVMYPGVDTDVERMVRLIDVAREAMGALERAGSALPRRSDRPTQGD